MIDIRTGDILRGEISKRALTLVQEWRKMHVEELLADWERARRREPLAYISPLE